MKLVQAPSSITFPHVRLAIELTRRRKPTHGHRWTTETVHLITDLDYQQATAALLDDTSAAIQIGSSRRSHNGQVRNAEALLVGAPACRWFRRAFSEYPKL